MIQIKQAHTHDNRHLRGLVRDLPLTLYRTHMAHPFIRICVPIYNGVSPCSSFAHHLDHQHLPHTRKIIPCLHAPPHRYKLPPHTGVLRGPGHSDRVAWEWAKHINSTNRISPWMPRMGMRDRHDPCAVARTRPGSSV